MFSYATIDLFLVLSSTFSVFLFTSGIRTWYGSVKFPGSPIIRTISGFIILAILVLIFPPSYPSQGLMQWELADAAMRVSEGRLRPILTIILILSTLSFGELFYAPLVQFISYTIGKILAIFSIENLSEYQRLNASVIIMSSIAIAVFIGVFFNVDQHPKSSVDEILKQNPPSPIKTTESMVVESIFDLPAPPTSVVLSGDNEGYMAFADGTIARFRLPISSQQNLNMVTVATGLSIPHGLAIANGKLYVTDQGPLLCKDNRIEAYPYFRCAFNSGGEVMPEGRAEIERIKPSRGQVVAFDIAPDGTLENQRVALKDLPVVNTDHGINGITNGIDGKLYLAIGGHIVVDRIFAEPGLYESLEHPNKDLIGTIVSFDPARESPVPEIFASGIRNVYGLVFDDNGNLFGIDNDGPSHAGWRNEELLHIKRGSNYGWPYEGTFGTPSIRNDMPLYILNSVGSAGIEYSERIGFQPGIIVGSFRKIEFIPIKPIDSGFVAPDKFSKVLVDSLPGNITGLVALPENRLLATLYGLRPDNNSLYVLQSTRN